MIPRKLQAREVEFEVVIEPEYTPFEGNCLASGDDAEDRAQEAWVRSELERGNELAWCSVLVRARWGDFEGWDSLGCVSCVNQKDLESVVDMRGMKQEALNHLNQEIARTAEKVTTLL